jgi:acyl carrier protein
VPSELRSRILEAIYAAIEECNRQLSLGAQLRPSADALLYGENSQLSSMSLVELIVVVEQRIEDDFGVLLILADEHALERANSPFRSVAVLADYIEERLKGGAE